ncbi:MAG: YIP1 family protein [Methanomicrobiales archaeon]|nr:YIP1 family protein [Methanomicrobiales archaeon]
MPIGVTGKVRGFLLKPSATFQATRKESLSSAFQYYVVLLIIFSILVFIVYTLAFTSLPAVVSGLLPAGLGAELSVYVVFVLFVLRLYGVFLSGLMYHVFVILFGGTEGVVQTIKTVMYASTPAFVLGWIPIIAIIGDIWALILLIIGLRENQAMPIGRAILVVLIPLAFSLIFVGSLVLVVGATFYRARLHALTGV